MTFLAYRVRRPPGQGRGYANIIARSEDGERFETIATVERESFDAESLERPDLVVAPDGTWRLCVSSDLPTEGGGGSTDCRLTTRAAGSTRCGVGGCCSGAELPQ